MSAEAPALFATSGDTHVLMWHTRGLDGRAGEGDRPNLLHLSLPRLISSCDWGRVAGRERVIGSWVHRDGFQALLRQAVPEEYDPSLFGKRNSWRLATRFACCLVRWERDVDVKGKPIGRLTPLFSLRNATMRSLNDDWVEHTEDLTAWVARHRHHPPPVEAWPPVSPYRGAKGLPGHLIDKGT